MNHELSDINYETKTGTCSVCGPVRVKFKGKYGRACWNQVYAGVKRYRERSKAYRVNKAKLRKENREEWNEPYRKHVKEACERCGMVALHPCQLDGHHKDGNRKNNDGSNIETLCPMCHRVEHLPEAEKAIYVSNKAKRDRECQPEPQKAVEAKETPVMGQARDNDVRQLLDSIGSMEQEIVELKGLLEEARSTNLDANGAYWKGMYVQLKTQVMKNNDLSQ